MHLAQNQVVYLKLTERRHSGLIEAVVHKVGRKWVHLTTTGRQDYRAPVGHPYLDGGKYSSPGRIWESEQAFADAQAQREHWAEFKRIVERHYDAPRGASAENLLEVCRILGIQS